VEGEKGEDLEQDDVRHGRQCERRIGGCLKLTK
jgi:hypothetical protein